nr:hypothetical protein [Tanacetum cinerariifolium]
FVVVPQAESIQLQLQRPRQQIIDILNGLKTWYLKQCGVKYRLAMTNMLSGESRIGGHKRQQFYRFAVNRESARDVYSKRRIIAVTELQIVKWHNYKHLDWITNKEKQNRLMRIDELHKFSDDTLNDVRTALVDRLKGIRMQYLPQTIWRRSDKDRAAAMIQSIDKQLKTRMIMQSLEKFVGGRLYEGDFRLLQRTI